MSWVTVEQAQVNLQIYLGRPRAAYDKLLEILGSDLNPLLTALSLPTINRFFYENEDLPATTKWPVMMIGGRWGYTELGMGPFVALVGEVVLVAATKPQATRQELQLVQDIVHAAPALLWDNTLRVYTESASDGLGSFTRTYWNPLVPGDIEPSPVEWKNFVGYALHLTMTQTPGNNLWR